MELTDKFTPEDTVKYASQIFKWRRIYDGVYVGNMGVIRFELSRSHKKNPKKYIIKACFKGDELGRYDSEKHEFPDSIEKVEAIFKIADKQ